MALYYDGNLDNDYDKAIKHPHVVAIQNLIDKTAYGRVQQIALQPFRDSQCDEDMFLAVKAVANLVGIFDFCWVTQVLWAERLANHWKFPTNGALDMSYSDQYQACLPPRD